MAWKKVQPGYRAGGTKNFISISPEKINFSRAFVESAQIQEARAVKVYVDSENYKIGFEFLDEKDSESLALAEVRRTLNCCSVGVISQFPWLKKYTLLEPQQRRFEPYKEDELWVINLPK